MNLKRILLDTKHFAKYMVKYLLDLQTDIQNDTSYFSWNASLRPLSLSWASSILLMVYDYMYNLSIHSCQILKLMSNQALKTRFYGLCDTHWSSPHHGVCLPGSRLTVREDTRIVTFICSVNHVLTKVKINLKYTNKTHNWVMSYKSVYLRGFFIRKNLWADLI